MNNGAFIWLAADYHFPTTYSCRVPLSSQSSPLAMPAPGPGTVRLALIRTGIELFGIDFVRDELFPVVRAAEIRIRPPNKVAISTQPLHAYKASPGESGSDDRFKESVIYREVCHAEGVMTVFIEVPISFEDAFKEMLESIGYWGQANSFACCIGIERGEPQLGSCATPLESYKASHPIGSFFSCIASDFRDTQLNWDEVIPALDADRSNPFRLEVYVWPMVIERQSDGKLLRRRSLN